MDKWIHDPVEWDMVLERVLEVDGEFVVSSGSELDYVSARLKALGKDYRSLEELDSNFIKVTV